MDVSHSPMKHFTKEKTKKNRKGMWKWKLKVTVTWFRIKKSILSALKAKQFRLSCASATPSIKQLSRAVVHVHQDQQPHRQQEANTIKKAATNDQIPSKSLAQLLLVPFRASDFVDNGDHMTPTISPKDDISSMWEELHGFQNWDGLLDPLHPWLRRELIKYGEFAEATYDAFDFDPLSEFCGSSRYNKHKFFKELGLVDHGYEVTKFIYAMSHVDVPKWFENSEIGYTWSKDSNWMGFVAVSSDRESKRIGRRDIVVSWRGTVAPTEWFSDLKAGLENFGSKNVKVQHGFLSIYKSKDESTRYNKSSASEQVMHELDKLVKFFKQRGEQVSLTLTGHSLGGALALLNAYEAASFFPDVYVNVLSFGAPRVGNLAFKEKLNELGVRTLRVVIRQDIVPKLPGMFNKILHKLNPIMQRLNCVYRHVGTQLKLDKLASPYLKDDDDYSACHNLELYLHLLDGFLSRKAKFRWNARRDLALVNCLTKGLF